MVNRKLSGFRLLTSGNDFFSTGNDVLRIFHKFHFDVSHNDHIYTTLSEIIFGQKIM